VTPSDRRVTGKPALASIAERHWARHRGRPEESASRSLSAAVVVPALREAIIEGRLPPGSRLSEAELGVQFGVSRTPVREAFAQLERDGLVTAVPRVGAFVRTVSVDDVDDIYQARMALETFAVALVTGRLTAIGRARLEEVLSAMRRSAEHGEPLAYTTELDRFYAIIMELAGNAVLRRMHESLLGPVRRLRRIAMSHEHRMPESLQHAEEIVRAIVSGNADAAVEAMREQLVTACEAAKDVVRHDHHASAPRHRHPNTHRPSNA